MASRVVGASDSVPWLQVYEAALVEIDPQVLPRRAEAARKAIHSQIMLLRNTDDAGQLWPLLDALRTLDDLLKMYKISPDKPSPLK
jgi:hypothetical protein